MNANMDKLIELMDASDADDLTESLRMLLAERPVRQALAWQLTNRANVYNSICEDVNFAVAALLEAEVDDLEALIETLLTTRNESSTASTVRWLLLNKNVEALKALLADKQMRQALAWQLTNITNVHSSICEDVNFAVAALLEAAHEDLYMAIDALLEAMSSTATD